ncbi:MAG: MarC family protein [Bauldia sp.]|uniref:MarC family protein n=1 Tax=Bauldia sp. TaxID=2575872 RepID=UPI001D818EE2|nr:MarC family protein [Bauldia sp.]MCB1495411.1 MarC family protein [Bauldia sp.]
MLEKLIHSFVTLFVTADPISIVPLFIVVTAGMSDASRRLVALRSVLIAGPILIAFALFGDDIIKFFGITIQAFEVAGGLLLFAIAFRMVFDSGKPADAPQDTDSDTGLTQIAVFPLAIPMMAGPGAISATILLTTHRDTWIDLVALVGIIVVLMGLIYTVLMTSERIDRWLGSIGRVVASRLLGVILAALAIQFVSEGVLAFATQIAKSA